MRNADVAARATRMPFTFFFAACLVYLAITLVSMWAQARAEGWASRGVIGGKL
jgi:polar amino acid transport system permease protein/arginine/ornithine transport system permease protein